MIQFVVRITSSLALLGAAIYVHQYLPNTEFYNRLVMALFAYFVADGPIYSLQKSADRIDNDEARETVVILAIAFQGFAVLGGSVFLLLGCMKLF